MWSLETGFLAATV